jgi:UDP-glucose:(heptosyl)LPS alpha-1,3-glucosyltransferase
MSTAEPPRLLIVTESLDTGRGGQERSVLEYGRALAALGADVAFVEGSGAPPPEGCRKIEVPVATGGRGKRFRALLESAEAVIAEHRGERLVQAMIPARGCHVYCPRSGLFPEIHSRAADSHRRAARRVASRLGTALSARRRLMASRERDLLRDPHGPALAALSTYVAESAARWYGLGPPRVRIVRNGIDVRPLRGRRVDATAIRREQQIPEGAVWFLAAAHNFRLKGIHQLVDAARRLPPGRAQITIAGKDEPIAGAPPNVRFLGAPPVMHDLLLAADVFVHPTFSDPSSRVVLEALAAGTPVVTTRWNGAADFVGAAGVVIGDPRDVDALAAAMVSLLDPQQRGCAAAATAGLAEAVSVERHAREMLAFFRELPR